MSTITRDVHGHKVTGEDDCLEGMNYLDHSLDFKEAEVFFHEAKSKGSAEFEDSHRKNYTLTRNSDGTYALEKRKSSGGWF